MNIWRHFACMGSPQRYEYRQGTPSLFSEHLLKKQGCDRRATGHNLLLRRRANKQACQQALPSSTTQESWTGDKTNLREVCDIREYVEHDAYGEAEEARYLHSPDRVAHFVQHVVDVVPPAVAEENLEHRRAVLHVR